MCVIKVIIDGDKLCPQAFSWLDGNGFSIEIAKKRPKMVHLQIDRFGAQRKVQIQNHKYFCVLQDLNVQPR